MTTGVELRFDAVPSGYVPSSSRNVTLGGGPPANLPEGTIGLGAFSHRCSRAMPG